MALTLTVVVLAALTAATLVVKTWRLVGEPGQRGAPDLYRYHGLIQLWSSGKPVYELPETRGFATYPPGSWPLFWIAYGWNSVGVARWVWAVLNLAALTALAVMFARALRDADRLARVAAALAPFAMPAMADALGIGQNTIVTLPLALGATLVAARRSTWKSDLLAAAMFDAALLKPNVTVPFFIPFLIVPGRLRPAVLCVAGYAILTLAGVRFQIGEVPTHIRGWLDQAEETAVQGYGNLQQLLLWLGWDGALMAGSVMALAGLAVFTWRYRHVDVWLLLGLAAVVSRVWVYHQVYDDAILIIALIALARLVTSRQTDVRLLPILRVALIASGLVLWVPIHFHYVGSSLGPLVVQPSWVWLFNASHVAVFGLQLIVLAAAAVRSPRPSTVRQAA